MATIRWCPIFSKWDIYQPLIDTGYIRISNILPFLAENEPLHLPNQGFPRYRVPEHIPSEICSPCIFPLYPPLSHFIPLYPTLSHFIPQFGMNFSRFARNIKPGRPKNGTKRKPWRPWTDQTSPNLPVSGIALHRFRPCAGEKSPWHARCKARPGGPCEVCVVLKVKAKSLLWTKQNHC